MSIHSTLSYKNLLRARLSVFAVASLAWASSATAGPGENTSFGTYYGSDFDSSWVQDLYFTEGSARSFSNRLDDEWRRDWGPTDLRGRKNRLEDSCDECSKGLDTADLVMLFTHSGFTIDGTVKWQMPEVGTFAESQYMELGEENDGLRALISFSCRTIRPYQGYKKHWKYAFNGGLIAVLGAVSCMSYDTDSSTRTEAFADYMLGNNSMWYAWKTQMMYRYSPELAVLTTTNGSCSPRTRVHLDDLTSTNRLTTGQYRWWCRRTASFN